MFKDYYAILDISIDATSKEIKLAFKKQALKWHPDKHQGMDTTSQMQEINEAYLILKDEDARKKYDIEHQMYQEYQRQTNKAESDSSSQSHEETKDKTYEESFYSHENYTIHDDILKKWMENAQKQSVGLAKQTIQDMKGMVVEGAKGAAIHVGYQIIGIVIAGLLFAVKSCS